MVLPPTPRPELLAPNSSGSVPPVMRTSFQNSRPEPASSETMSRSVSCQGPASSDDDRKAEARQALRQHAAAGAAADDAEVDLVRWPVLAHLGVEDPVRREMHVQLHGWSSSVERGVGASRASHGSGAPKFSAK